MRVMNIYIKHFLLQLKVFRPNLGYDTFTKLAQKSKAAQFVKINIMMLKYHRFKALHRKMKKRMPFCFFFFSNIRWDPSFRVCFFVSYFAIYVWLSDGKFWFFAVHFC